MNQFGVHSLGELKAMGMTDALIGEDLDAGRLTRVTRGWYATVLAHSSAVQALGLGGRVGCLSGCRLHGLWVPFDNQLHVLLNPGADTPPPQSGHVFHRVRPACQAAVASLADCLMQVVQRHDVETGLIAGIGLNSG